MSDSNSTSLFGIVFWCVALAVFLVWALIHLGHVDVSLWGAGY